MGVWALAIRVIESVAERLRRAPPALAPVVKAMAAGAPIDHPTLAIPGWWRRPERLLYPPQ
jgi:hypothetical protein